MKQNKPEDFSRGLGGVMVGTVCSFRLGYLDYCWTKNLEGLRRPKMTNSVQLRKCLGNHRDKLRRSKLPHRL
jgi:hypothetical protein